MAKEPHEDQGYARIGGLDDAEATELDTTPQQAPAPGLVYPGIAPAMGGATEVGVPADVHQWLGNAAIAAALGLGESGWVDDGFRCFAESMGFTPDAIAVAKGEEALAEAQATAENPLSAFLARSMPSVVHYDVKQTIPLTRNTSLKFELKLVVEAAPNPSFSLKKLVVELTGSDGVVDLFGDGKDNPHNPKAAGGLKFSLDPTKPYLLDSFGIDLPLIAAQFDPNKERAAFTTGNSAASMTLGLDAQVDPSVPASLIVGMKLDPLHLLTGMGALDEVLKSFEPYGLKLTLNAPFSFRGIVNERGIGVTEASAQFKIECVTTGDSADEKPFRVGLGAEGELKTDYGLAPSHEPVSFTKTTAEAQVYIIVGGGDNENRIGPRWETERTGALNEVALEADRLRGVAIQRALEDAFVLLNKQPRPEVIAGINLGIAAHYEALIAVVEAEIGRPVEPGLTEWKQVETSASGGVEVFTDSSGLTTAYKGDIGRARAASPQANAVVAWIEGVKGETLPAEGMWDTDFPRWGPMHIRISNGQLLVEWPTGEAVLSAYGDYHEGPFHDRALGPGRLRAHLDSKRNTIAAVATFEDDTWTFTARHRS